MPDELSVFPVKDRSRELFGGKARGVISEPGRDGKLKARVLRYARGKSLKAVRILSQIMEDAENSAVVRKDAAIAVLNRAWGAPRQEIEIADAGATLEEMLISLWAAKSQAIENAENIATIDLEAEPEP